MDVDVKSILKSLEDIGIRVPEDWVEDCVQFVLEEHREHKIEPTQNSVRAKVYEQWTLADLRELKYGAFPKQVATASRIVLPKAYCVQVNSMIDISQSAYSQRQNLEGADNENANVDAEAEAEAQADADRNTWENKSNRMLCLELTDGVVTVKGIEDRIIPALTRDLQPGFKLRLKGPIECRKGILFLTPDNVDVLGGNVEQLMQENTQSKLLKRKLDIQGHAFKINKESEGPELVADPHIDKSDKPVPEAKPTIAKTTVPRETPPILPKSANGHAPPLQPKTVISKPKIEPKKPQLTEEDFEIIEANFSPPPRLLPWPGNSPTLYKKLPSSSINLQSSAVPCSTSTPAAKYSTQRFQTADSLDISADSCFSFAFTSSEKYAETKAPLFKSPLATTVQPEIVAPLPFRHDLMVGENLAQEGQNVQILNETFDFCEALEPQPDVALKDADFEMQNENFENELQQLDISAPNVKYVALPQAFSDPGDDPCKSKYFGPPAQNSNKEASASGTRVDPELLAKIDLKDVVIKVKFNASTGLKMRLNTRPLPFWSAVAAAVEKTTRRSSPQIVFLKDRLDSMLHTPMSVENTVRALVFGSSKLTVMAGPTWFLTIGVHDGSRGVKCDVPDDVIRRLLSGYSALDVLSAARHKHEDPERFRVVQETVDNLNNFIRGFDGLLRIKFFPASPIIDDSKATRRMKRPEIREFISFTGADLEGIRANMLKKIRKE